MSTFGGEHFTVGSRLDSGDLKSAESSAFVPRGGLEAKMLVTLRGETEVRDVYSDGGSGSPAKKSLRLLRGT